jgi:hypothetical protein
MITIKYNAMPIQNYIFTDEFRYKINTHEIVQLDKKIENLKTLMVSHRPIPLVYQLKQNFTYKYM